MSEWPFITLKEAGVSLIDCDHKTPKAQEEGFPYIGIPQLKDGRITSSGARLITEEDFHQWRRKAKPTPNDVILSRRCNPGEIAYVPENLDIALGQNLVLLRSDGGKVYPPFLRWVAQGSNWWHQVNKYINVGAVFDSLKCADIPKFEFRLPPLAEQKRIAKILVGLDNKIELNRQTNQTLEQIALAIFKSWFVDFEPTRAKIVAKRNGHDIECAAMCAISGKSLSELDKLSAESQRQLKATAALFPDALVESELGEIPEGWDVESFTKVATLDTTSVKPNMEPEKIWEHYSIPAFDVDESPAYELGEEIKSNKYKVDKHAILSSKLNPHFPRTWWPDIEDETAAICSTEFMQFIPNDSNHRSFVLGMILSAPFQESIMQRVTGSTGSRQRAQPPQVANMDVVMPSIELIEAYSSKFTSFSIRKAKNKKESLTLSKLRDTLLPKLLSGQLSIEMTQTELEQSLPHSN